ncbi:MAG: hypothetical protein L6R42_008060 [Xanthoria sp. 1 TBL-2021]|nr:MAG: hypothetical protein L6R42_008060 [Xanthoria sp. 1 TBL-2021]
MASSPPPPLAPILIGISTKMYFDLPTTTKYISSLSNPPSPISLFVIPSFPALPAAHQLLADKNQLANQIRFPPILLGAQNCHHEDTGPFTGEVSPLMLKQLGCSIVEIGHAERRAPPFYETEDMITLKAQAAIRNNLIPLICIGERTRSTVASESVGIAISECGAQIRAILDAVPRDRELIFAYEPVWAIGAEKPAPSYYIFTVVGQLKRLVQGREGGVRWLYGGSAGPGIWGDLKGAVDGLFLGRFAHDVGNVEKILKEVAEGR